MKKHNSLNICGHIENAWQKSQAEIATQASTNNEQTAPTILLYFKLKNFWLKHYATQEAQQKFAETNINNRCEKLHLQSKSDLAQEYLIIATQAYNNACERSNYQPEPSVRGTHIHKIAETLALDDRAKTKQCTTIRYPFDGIEQCYYLGVLSGFGAKFSNMLLPCGAKPDLIDTSTGDVYDFKTGPTGTNLRRHKKNLQHVPKPKTGVISSYDVTIHKVKLKYSSRVSKPNI